MPKYQYQLSLLDGYGSWEGAAGLAELTRRLNELAALGWEVVAVPETTVPRGPRRGLLATLKRKLPAA